jgi:hypothetical protein
LAPRAADVVLAQGDHVAGAVPAPAHSRLAHAHVHNLAVAFGGGRDVIQAGAGS